MVDKSIFKKTASFLKKSFKRYLEFKFTDNTWKGFTYNILETLAFLYLADVVIGPKPEPNYVMRDFRIEYGGFKFGKKVPCEPYLVDNAFEDWIISKFTAGVFIMLYESFPLVLSTYEQFDRLKNRIKKWRKARSNTEISEDSGYKEVKESEKR